MFLADAVDRGGDGAVGADDGGGGGQEMGDVGVELTILRAARRPAPPHHRHLAHLAVAHDEVLGVETAVRDVRAVQDAHLLPGVVDGVGIERVAVHLLGDEDGERTAGARDHDVRDARVHLLRQQHGVRLVLDLLSPGRKQGRRRVPKRDPAPDAGEELRVGLVATDRDHAERPVRAVGEEDRARDRLLVGGTHAVERHVEVGERARHLLDRRPARRGAEDEVHERRDAPAEDDRAHDVGGK